MKKAEEFKKELEQILTKYAGIAELYAANVITPSGEITQQIKIRELINKKDEDNTKK